MASAFPCGVRSPYEICPRDAVARYELTGFIVLVIKPGGLVSSVYGKLIMIAAFCFVTFSLAFHKVTRPYSLIFSISFGGATAIVLGIDCFSRAGLKEFWIYIWGNDDLSLDFVAIAEIQMSSTQ